MKFNIILAVLVVVMGYVTCRNFQKDRTTEGAGTAAPEYQYGAPPGVKASRVIHGSNPDSAVGVQIHEPPAYVDVKGAMQSLPPATASHRAYLSTGWWHLNMAYQPSDTTVHENYIRKWLHFREDQTFDVLQDNQVVDSGTWNWDDPNNVIYLSCKDPYINNTWKVIDKGFVMIWKGNTDLNVTGIQVRVANSRTAPTWE
jgi:hypothetical protein